MSLLLALLMVLEVFSPVAVSARSLLDGEENHNSIMSEPRVDSKSILGPETKPKKVQAEDDLFSVPAKKAEPNKETNKLQEAPARQKESSTIIETPEKESPAQVKEPDKAIIEAGRQREQKAEDKLNQAVERAKQAEQNAKASENLNLETTEIEKPGYKAWRVVNRIKAIYKDGKLDCQGLLIEVEDFKGNKKTLTYDDILKDKNIIVNKEIKEGLFGSSELIITTPGLRDIKIDVKVENMKKDKDEKSALSLNKDNSNKLENKENTEEKEEKEGLLDKLKETLGLTGLQKADKELKKALADEKNGLEEIQALLNTFEEKYELSREDQAKLMADNEEAIQKLIERDRNENFRPQMLLDLTNEEKANLGNKKFTIRTRFDTSTAVGPIKAGQFFNIHLDKELKVNNPNTLEPIKYNGRIIARPEYDERNKIIKYTIAEDINENIQVPLNIPVDYDVENITLDNDGIFVVTNKVSGLGVKAPKDLVPQKVDRNGNPAGSIIEPGRHDVTEIIDSTNGKYKIYTDASNESVVEDGKLIGYNWSIKITSDTDLKTLGYKANFTTVKGSGLGEIKSNNSVVLENQLGNSLGIVSSKHHSVDTPIYEVTYDLFTPTTNTQKQYMMDLSIVLTGKKDAENKSIVGAKRFLIDEGWPEEKVKEATPNRVGMNNRTTILGEFTSNDAAKWTVTDGVSTGDVDKDKNISTNLPLETRTLGNQTFQTGKVAVYGLDADGKMVTKIVNSENVDGSNNITDIPTQGKNPGSSDVGTIAVYEYNTTIPTDNKNPQSLGGVEISRYEDILIDQSWTLDKNLKMPNQTIKALDPNTNGNLGSLDIPASTNGDPSRSIVMPEIKVWDITSDGTSVTATRVQPKLTQVFPTTDKDAAGKPIKYYENNNYYLKETNQYYIRNRGTVEVIPKLASFTLIKTGTDGKPLPGATFKLLNGPEVVTDDQGRAVFSNIEPGTHQLVETKAPLGYKVNTSNTIINVDEEGRLRIIEGPGKLSVGTIPTVTVSHPTWPDYMNAMQYATIDEQGNVVAYIFLKANAAQNNGSTDRDTRLSLYMNNGNISNVEVFDVDPTSQRIKLKSNMIAQTADQMVAELGNSVLNQSHETPIKGKENTEDSFTGKTGYQIELPTQRFNNDWGFLVKVTGTKSEENPSLTYDWLTDGDYDTTNNNAKLQNQNIVPTSTKETNKETTITITNKAFETRPVEVTKMDKDKTGIAGATFVIKDEKGNPISTITSGLDGKVSFGKLPEGKYTIEEIKAPKDYMKSNVIFNVTVDSSNQVTYEPKFKTGLGNPVNGEDYYIQDEEQSQEENKNVVTSVTQTLSIQENEDGDIGQRPGVWEAYRLESLKYKATIGLGDTAPGKRFSIQFDPNLDFTQYFGEFPKLKILGKEVADPYFDYNTNRLTYVFNNESAGGKGTADINFRGIIPSKYFAKNDNKYTFTITVAPGQTNLGEQQTIHQDIVADYGQYDYDPADARPSQSYYFRDVYQKEDGSWYVTVLAYFNPHFVRTGGNNNLNFNWKSTNYQDGNYVNWKGNGQRPAFSLQDVKVYRTSPILRKVSVGNITKTVNDNMPLSFGVRPEQDPYTYHLLYSKSIDPESNITNDRQNGITLSYDKRRINPWGSLRDKGPLTIKMPDINNRNQDGYIIEQTFKIDDMYKFNNAWRAFNMSNDRFNSAFITRANYNKATGDQTGGEIPKFYSQKVGLINKKYTPGKFSIEKTNELDSNTKLSGAIFSLTDSDNNVIFRTTDTDGKINFTDLKPGSYTLKEEKAPDKYNKSDKTWKVDVNSDGNVYINEIGIGASNNPLYGNEITLPVTNQPTATKFVVYKKDGDNQPLQGAEFKLTKKDETTVFATGTSNDKGVVNFDKDLTHGTYILEETKAPAGYKKLNQKWVVEVDASNKAKVYEYVEGNQNPTDPKVNQSLLGNEGTKWVNVAKRPLTGWVLGDNRQTGYYNNYPVPYKLGTRIVAINKKGSYVIQRYVINPEANPVTLDKAIIHREKPEYENMNWYNGDEEIKIFSLDKAVTNKNIEDIRLENYKLTELKLGTDVTESTVKVNEQNRLQLDFTNKDINKPIIIDVKVPYTSENGGIGTGMDLYTNEGTFWKSDYYNFVTDIVEGDPVVTTGTAGNIKGAHISDDSLEVNNTVLKQDFSFKKIREDSTDAVSGATFKLVGPQPKKDEVYKTSDANGVVSFKNLLPGVYKLVETGAAQGYDKANTDWTVTITRDGKVYVRDNNEGNTVPDNDPAKQWQKVKTETKGTVQGHSDVQGTPYGNRLETRITEVNKAQNKFRQVFIINRGPEKLDNPYFEIHSQQENRPLNLSNTRILSVKQVERNSTFDNLIPVEGESNIGYKTEVYVKNNDQERIKITPTNLAGDQKTVAITIESDLPSSGNIGTGIDFYNYGTNHYWLSEYYDDLSKIQLDSVPPSTTGKNTNMIIGENGTGLRSNAKSRQALYAEAGLHPIPIIKTMLEEPEKLELSGNLAGTPLRGAGDLEAISPYNVDSSNANITVSADAVDTTNGQRTINVSVTPKEKSGGSTEETIVGNNIQMVFVIDRSKDIAAQNGRRKGTLDNNINKLIYDIVQKAKDSNAGIDATFIEYDNRGNAVKGGYNQDLLALDANLNSTTYNMATPSNPNGENVTIKDYLRAVEIKNRSSSNADGNTNLAKNRDNYFSQITNTNKAYDKRIFIDISNFSTSNASRWQEGYVDGKPFYKYQAAEIIWPFRNVGNPPHFDTWMVHVDQLNENLNNSKVADYKKYMSNNTANDSISNNNVLAGHFNLSLNTGNNNGTGVNTIKDFFDTNVITDDNFIKERIPAANDPNALLVKDASINISLNTNINLVNSSANIGSNNLNPTTTSSGFSLSGINLKKNETLNLSYTINLKNSAENNTDYIIHNTMTYKPDATSNAVNLDSNSMIIRRNAETPATYTVSFDGNGGTWTMNPVTVNKDTNYELPACSFIAPEGKEFKAWEVNGQEKNPGDTIIVNTDTIVKALWKNKASDTYTITIAQLTNGTVTADKQSAVANDTVTLTVNPATNYELDTLTVKDANNQSVNVDMTNYTFTMPASNVTITATFKPAQTATYQVNLTQPAEGGTISASPTSAAEGAEVTLTATPKTGYVLDNFTVTAENGDAVAVTNNKFKMPKSNVKVTASFKKSEDPLDNFKPEEGKDILIKDLTNDINKLLEITNKTSGLDLRIIKKNIDNEPLKGAKFTIKKMTDDKFTTEDTTFTHVSGVSDENGNIVFKDNDGNIVKLQKGFYILTEDEAPIGYKKITADWKIEVKDEKGQIYAEYKGPEETPTTFVDDNDKSNAGKSADNDTIKYKSRLTYIDPESKKFVQRIYIDTRSATSDIMNVQITPKYKREEIDTPSQPPVTIKEGVKTAYRLTYKITDPDTNKDIQAKDFDKILRTYDLSRKDMTMVNTARWRPFDWGFDEDQLNLGKGVYIIEVEGYYDDSIIDGTVTNEVKIDNNYNILDAAGNIITDLKTQTPGKVDSYDRTKLPTTDPRYINPADLGKIDLHVDFYDGERKFKQLKFDENGNKVYEAFDGASFQGGASSVRKKYEDALIAQGKTKEEAKKLADAWANLKPAGQKYANFVGRKVKLDGTDYDTGKIDPALPTKPSNETDTSINLKPLYNADKPSRISKDGLEVENDKESYNITFSKHGRDDPSLGLNDQKVTDNRLEGAIFKLQKLVAGGYEDVPGTYVSSAFNGYFGFRGLKPGRYRLMEVQAPKGYVPIKDPVLHFSIAYKGEIIDGQTGEVTPGKGVITLEYNNNADSIVQYAGANAEGHGKLVDFVTSATAKNMGKIVNNKPGKGKVTINKKDGLGNVLPGSEFKLTRTSLKKNEDGTVSQDSVKTGTVGEDGKLIFDNLIIGNYLLEETKPASGHENKGQIWRFTVGGKGLDPYEGPIEPTGDDLTNKISIEKSEVKIIKPDNKNETAAEGTIWPNSAHLLSIDNDFKITEGTLIKPGDYFQVKLSDYIDLYGIYDKDLVSGLDIFADGIGTIAKAKYDDVNGVITYTFTEYAKTYELLDFKANLIAHINRFKLKTSQDQVPVGLKMMNDTTEDKFKKVDVKFDLGTHDVEAYGSTPNMSSKITYFNNKAGEFEHIIYLNRDQKYIYDGKLIYTPSKDIENVQFQVHRVNYDYINPNNPNAEDNMNFILPPSYGVDARYNRNNGYMYLFNTNSYYYPQVSKSDPIVYNFPNGYLQADDTYVIRVIGNIKGEDKSSYEAKANFDRYNSYGYPYMGVEREDYIYALTNENTAEGKLEITAINPENEISFKKVDQDSRPLQGAKFGLLKYDTNSGKWSETTVAGSEKSSGEDGLITYKKLEPGKYALIEITAPSGYAKIEGHIKEFTVGDNGVITQEVKKVNASTENQGTSSAGKLMNKVKSLAEGVTGNDANQPVTETIGTSPIEVINYKEIEFKKIDGDTRSGLKGAIFEVWYKEKETDNEYQPYEITKDGKDVTMTVTSGEGGTFKLNVSKDGYYALKETKAPEGYGKYPGHYIKEFKLEKGQIEVLEKDPLKVSLTKGASGKISSQILEIDKEAGTFKQRLIINPKHESWSFDGPDTQLRIFTNDNWSIDPTDNNSISKVKVAVVENGKSRKSIGDLKEKDFTEKQSFNYNTADSIRRFRIKDLINDTSGATTLTTDKAIVIDVIGKLAAGKTSADLKSEIYFDYTIIDEVTYNLDTNNTSDGKGTYIEPVLPIEVENRKAEYPWTGGIGTLIFTVSGLILMSAAAYVYSRKRRASYDE